MIIAPENRPEILQKIHQQSFTSYWNTEFFKSLLNQNINHAYSACENDEPLGFILLSIVEEEAEILTMTVLPKVQHKKIGTMLLETTIKLLRDKKIIRFLLDVAETNHAALGLYKKTGFIEYSRRKAYYRDGADAILMEKFL